MENFDYNKTKKEMNDFMEKAITEANDPEYKKQLIESMEKAKNDALEACKDIDYNAMMADMKAITDKAMQDLPF